MKPTMISSFPLIPTSLVQLLLLLDSDESSLERKSREKRFGLMAGGESGSEEASNRLHEQNHRDALFSHKPIKILANNRRNVAGLIWMATLLQAVAGGDECLEEENENRRIEIGAVGQKLRDEEQH
ncbi:hypothetical protein WR25_13975 [Diploscapter pachys]|uniref:Uncharacterized protein n=1 Tax=Diploscapter pachys TaxID=2018661 RepID=A0A2A2M107_9BILA|nr:hypothetical protein WR25_13975 [Diploscapter pachys]